MFEIKVVLSGLAVALMVSVVGSATAFAEKCPARKGTAPVLCLEPSAGVMEDAPVGTKLMNLSMLVDSRLKGEVAFTRIEILGLLNLLELEYEGEGKGKGSTTFDEVHVLKPAQCSIGEPLTATGSVVLSEEGLEKYILTLTGNKTSGTETEIFAEFEFKNKGVEVCPLKGQKANVKGKQVVHYGGATSLPLAVNNLAVTNFTDSSLKFGSGKAEFQIQWPDVALWNGAAFTHEPWGVLGG